MDEIADNVGGLSLNAKEWRPGGGQGVTTNNSTKQLVSSQSGNDGSWGAAAVAASDATAATSLSSQVIDKNGTHYFGNSAISNNSWEQRGGLNNGNENHNHTTLNTNTTMPSRHHPQNNNRTILHTSSTASLLNRSSNHNSLSLPLEEYHHYQLLSNQSVQEMDPNDIRHKAVPPSFTHAYCLDDDNTLVPSNTNTNKQHQHQQQRSSFGYPTSLFRVTSISDGKLYTLRRLDSVRCVSHKIAQTVMYQWLSNINGREEDNDGSNIHITSGGAGFDHPGVVRWYKCFISQRAIFFIHHYHAGSVTLRERFFSHHHHLPGGQMSTNGVGVSGIPLPEPLIWSCLTQLVSAIRAVHGNNLAVRTLQLNHILCTQENNTLSLSSSSVVGLYGLPKLRYRINCIGIVDILEFESRKSVEELQEMDMRSLGCILLSMTTGTEINCSDLYTNGGQHQQQQERLLYEYMKFVQQNYSRDLYTIVQSLLHPNTPPATIQAVASSMAMHAFDELDDAYICIDERHASLIGIYESGRALRLLLKLAFVNERPEFGIDTNWSESGDCYILKLFRDYVFHQADIHGKPIMDLGHVISSLNKLDAADDEQIVLVSRDGKNVMVVSYADVAWCLERSYQELCSSSVPIPSLT